MEVIFLSTLSLRRATANALPIVSPTVFLSTLSLRRATFLPRFPDIIIVISIHALLAESDLAPKENTAQKAISIHALLAESDWRNNLTERRH